MSALNPNLATHMRNAFPGSDGDSIVEFLSKDFSNNGQVVFADLFIYGKEADKKVQEILSVLEKFFASDYQYQHPDIRGDLDIPGRGEMNQRLLIIIYSQLGIPLPNRQ